MAAAHLGVRRRNQTTGLPARRPDSSPTYPVRTEASLTLPGPAARMILPEDSFQGRHSGDPVAPGRVGVRRGCIHRCHRRHRHGRPVLTGGRERDPPQVLQNALVSKTLRPVDSLHSVCVEWRSAGFLIPVPV